MKAIVYIFPFSVLEKQRRNEILWFETSVEKGTLRGIRLVVSVEFEVQRRNDERLKFGKQRCGRGSAVEEQALDGGDDDDRRCLSSSVA
ncbi:unnamed protein product [Soboliphyme baturini]|uniref:Uncharacterized protein n=1 Tax=Soboliphyme baturini TaxID=241478 RepID=A0A183J410_9BILA|nr:unnamed protein product [Soboliphyme baturini]